MCRSQQKRALYAIHCINWFLIYSNAYFISGKVSTFAIEGYAYSEASVPKKKVQQSWQNKRVSYMHLPLAR